VQTTKNTPPGTHPVQTPPQTNTAPLPSDIVASDIAEVGGFNGPEPTRYGDWEKDGRCVDF